MKTLITIIGITLSSYLFAQPSFEWGHGFGNEFNDQSRDVCYDNAGNTYVIGQFNGVLDFDPGIGVTTLTSGGQPNGFIQKFDQSGNLIWAKGFLGGGLCTPQSVSVNSLGQILISGDFNGEIDFDPNAGSNNITAVASKDIFVLLLEGSGTLNWISTINAGNPLIDNQGNSSNSRVRSIFDSNNNICITGTFNGTVDFDPGVGVLSITSSSSIRDAFVMKLDFNGLLLWAHTFGNSSGDSHGICIDVGPNNEIYAGGMFNDVTIDFNPGVGIFNLNANSKDNWILKLDPQGNFIWAKMIDNINGLTFGDEIRDLVVDSSGDLFVTGQFQGFTDFNPSLNDSIIEATLVDGFILKLSSNGDFNWVRVFTGLGYTFPLSMDLDNQGNIYTVGSFEGNHDLDPGIGINTVSASGRDIYASQLDSNGEYGWGIVLNGSANESRPHISVNLDYDVLVTGNFPFMIDLDPGPNTSTVNSSGTWAFFTVKLSQCIPSSLTPDLAVLPDLTGDCTVSSPIIPSASNCTGTFVGVPDQSFPITTQGLTLITWTYDDGNGNTATQTQEVIINDVTAPSADAATLANLTDECEITSLTAPTATDNCVGAVTGTHSATLPITSTTTITWTYDDGNGNTSTQTQEVIIDDVTAPVADAALLTVLTDECEITALTVPTATDNCAGTITGTHNATLPITSTTTITWTYDDGNGNTSTQTQEVIINDITAPVADAASLADLTDECEITALTAPIATDNCAGTITGTHNATLPITATTTINWTYDDGNGNTSTQTQEVIIDDVTAPVADAASLADLTDECEITALTEPTATDNCAESVTVTNDATLPITSTTTITWTYDDGNGNTSTQTQEVIITPIDNSVSVVDDVTLSADASGYTYQWVDCNDNNAPIAGETNQTFEATSNGSYAVIIDNGDCSVTSACFDITTVGLDKNEMQTINVFPNPTSGTVTINSSTQFNTVEVVNLMGQVVYATTLNEVSTHQMELPEAKGVYLIKVSGNNSNNTFRIIKK